MSFWCHRFDQTSNENIVRISALEFFVASWGLPGDLVSNIISPKKLPGSPKEAIKTFRAEILTISLLFFKLKIVSNPVIFKFN